MYAATEHERRFTTSLTRRNPSVGKKTLDVNCCGMDRHAAKTAALVMAVAASRET